MFKKSKKKVQILINNKEEDFDEDFWESLEDEDLKEAIEEYVRDSDDFFVWID